MAPNKEEEEEIWADAADHWQATPLVKEKKVNKMVKKMAVVKTLAAEGFVKAKSASIVGVNVVKVGTTKGFKFVKKQCKKRDQAKKAAIVGLKKVKIETFKFVTEQYKKRDETKKAALVGFKKVMAGTTKGLKFVKKQCKKRKSASS